MKLHKPKIWSKNFCKHIFFLLTKEWNSQIQMNYETQKVPVSILQNQYLMEKFNDI